MVIDGDSRVWLNIHLCVWVGFVLSHGWSIHHCGVLNVITVSISSAQLCSVCSHLAHWIPRLGIRAWAHTLGL